MGESISAILMMILLTIIFIFLSPNTSANGQQQQLAIPTGVVPVADVDGAGSQRCQPVNYLFCDITGYETLANFNNNFGHKTSQDAIAELAKFAYLFKDLTCLDFIQPFLCSLYLPVCPKAANQVPLPEILLPCMNECISARKHCEPILNRSGQTWPTGWDCDKFPNEDQSICFAKQRNTSLSTTNTVCDEGDFDCNLRSPLDSGRKALCIARAFVCDGKTDCDDGLDEVGCSIKSQPSTCLDGQINCNEEYIDMTSLIQCILCILVLFSAIILAVRYYIVYDQMEKQAPSLNQNQPTLETLSTAQSIENQNVYSVYEPADTVSVYERINTGGYSGVSSVYDSYACYLPHTLSTKYDDLREPPAAPPPTPSQQSIYLNADIFD